MKTQEIMAVVVLIAVVGWIGFMASNASATYSPVNSINAATNSAAPYNAQSGAQQAAGQGAAAQTGGAAAGSQASSAQGGAGQTVTIPVKVVGGYYEPRQITVKQGTKVRLDLDPNTMVGCMTTFNVWGLNLKKYVTQQDHILEFTADKAGVYKTSCNMGMGDGRLVVEAAGANTAAAGSAQTGAGSAVQVQNTANNAQLAAPTNPSAGPAAGSCGSGGCGGSCGGSGGCGCGGSR